MRPLEFFQSNNLHSSGCLDIEKCRCCNFQFCEKYHLGFVILLNLVWFFFLRFSYFGKSLGYFALCCYRGASSYVDHFVFRCALHGTYFISGLFQKMWHKKHNQINELFSLEIQFEFRKFHVSNFFWDGEWMGGK